ncbi:MAG: choice-of-anchor J domain-containing protein, partial [candidate division Zixibacteria bacterium]|nr:choice-of-anchor J domain-containing protein [candidate division Zixibacteria bacterium]
MAEDFEVSVPPATWSAIATHTDTMTWYQNNYDPYSGTYYADCKYDEALVPQDEWLITPLMDFDGASTDLKVEFYFFMSYAWSVDPDPNYDLELWISTDAGATWPTKLWDQHAQGVFSDWTYYKVTIDLSAYVGEKDVKLAWRYVGTDGAEAAIDLVSVNDDPPPVGRCCYGDPFAPSCDLISEMACTALSGKWDGALTCADACPVAGPGDNCEAPVTLTVPAALPYTDNNYTCGRLDDYNLTCLGGYDGGEDIIYEMVVTEAVDLDLTVDPQGTTWTGILVDDACPPDAGTCLYTATNSGGTVYKMANKHFEPGTYFIMLDTYPSPDCIPAFTLTIEAPAPASPGDNCANPIPVSIPAALPYTDNNYTCGRVDDYNATCLGYYDGGEDIIYELNVTATTKVDIALDPLGTTYTGILIDATCPPNATTCIAMSTMSGSTPHGMYGVELAPGTYYIMIDTWPSPACIPSFDLSITEFAGGIENDDWVNATKLDDVTDLAFTTIGASFDGPGGCLTSPNIWYCYTASCDGNATFDLCSSSYDTKMAIYDGCGDPATSTLLACNDDACGVQSKAVVAVTAGNEYLIEVGGYGTNVGAGLLTVSCASCPTTPPNDNCSDVTPVTLTAGVTSVLTGDNTCATSDCPDLAPATEAWEAITLPEKMDLVITYCGTTPAFELVYIILVPDCPCSGTSIFAAATDWDACGDGNVTMTFPGLDAGTYYLPVLAFHPDYTTEYYQGPYTVNVTGTTWVPHYCDASGGCDEYISNVAIADINNTSACDGYGDYTGQIANLTYGTPYPITITLGTSYSSDYGGVWVDWNQDLDFDDAGEAITLDVSAGTGPYTGSITVPGDATPGNTRMRVRLSYSSYPPACGTTSYGDVEDYTINVGGEQSTLTLDPAAISFGPTPIGSTGNTTLTLGADGEANINYSIAITYGKKASVGGDSSPADPTLKRSSFQNSGIVPPIEKDAKALLFEGFEGTVPPAGWTAVVNNPYTWVAATTAPYEGVQNANCYYDEDYTGNQDEWLISPVIDFAGGKYVLDFWWNGTYYWSVDPYDNCDLSIMLSTDGGVTFPVTLWTEEDYGVFESGLWTWHNTIVDLSAFKDQSNVKLAIVYSGYDGAQFGVDAFGINPAPLSWLSATPTSGTITGNSTVPVTVAFDAADLENGTYNGSLVITHTGAMTKATATVPVTLVVGASGAPNITPDPIYAFYEFAINPMTVNFAVKPDDVAGDLADIDLGSLLINGVAPVTAAMDGDNLAMTMGMVDFIHTYPLMWDVVEGIYTVSGEFTGPVPFSVDFPVALIGHISGDVNLDQKINIGDAVFI